jgi:hypothetical protein
VSILSWQELYKAAMVERDHTQLQKRIEAAHAVIRQRIEELKLGSACDESSEERQAIADALHSLRTLQKIGSRVSPEGDTQGGKTPHGET